MLLGNFRQQAESVLGAGKEPLLIIRGVVRKLVHNTYIYASYCMFTSTQLTS
jgi:hypothetical protein